MYTYIFSNYFFQGAIATKKTITFFVPFAILIFYGNFDQMLALLLIPFSVLYDAL
ncbi:hypothetical protein CsatB_005686 [Cannabis sativa]